MKHLLLIFILDFLICHVYGQSESTLILGKCDNDYGKSISILSDKSKIIVGSTYNYIGDGSEHILISRFDSIDNQLWSEVFYGESDDIIYDATLLNGDFVFVGTTRRTINNSHAYRTVVFRINKNGLLKWSKIYNIGLGYKTQVTNDSCIIVTGKCYSEDGIDRLFALCLDSEGNVNWNKTFYFGRPSCGEDIVVSSDKTIFITGYIGHPGGGNWFNSRPVLIKLDSQGNLIWKYYYLFNNSTSSYVRTHHRSSMIQSESDSNIYLIGTNIDGAGGNWICHILKINSQNGDIIWNKTYNPGYNDYFKQIVELNQKLYLFGNYSYDNYDMFLIKTDLNGLPMDSYVYGDNNDNYFDRAFPLNDGFEIIGSTNNFFGDSVSLTMSDIISFKINSNCYHELQIDSNIVVEFDSFSSIASYSDFYMEDVNIENQQITWNRKEINSILSATDCEPLKIISSSCEQDIKIFPNPVKNKLTVISSEPIQKIEIFNLLGQIKYSRQLNKNEKIFDLSSIVSGVYFISIYQNSKINTYTIMKE